VNVLSTVDRISSRVTCFIRQRPVTNRERPISAETAHLPRDIAGVVGDRRLANRISQRHVDVIPAGHCDVNALWTGNFWWFYVCNEETENSTQLH